MRYSCFIEGRVRLSVAGEADDGASRSVRRRGEDPSVWLETDARRHQSSRKRPREDCRHSIRGIGLRHEEEVPNSRIVPPHTHDGAVFPDGDAGQLAVDRVSCLDPGGPKVGVRRSSGQKPNDGRGVAVR